MGLAIDITIEHAAWDALGDLDLLAEKAAAAALAEAAAAVPDGTELSLVFADDAFIRTLNRDWRDKDRPTNVLSFPADPSARAVTLGDVVIAYETTAGEAAVEGRALRDHVIHLIIHGVLHLIGFDHETDGEAETMERLEVRALTTLGIASPYEDASEDARPLRTHP